MTKIKKKWHHKEVLRGMYIDQGLTIRQIAQILGTTAATIKYWMNKFDIEGRVFCIGDVTRGVAPSQEKKDNLSKIAKERFKRPENHPMFGHRHTEEAKRKMSETKKQRNRERRGEKI